VPKERSGAESEHQAVNELDPTTYAKVWEVQKDFLAWYEAHVWKDCSYYSVSSSPSGICRVRQSWRGTSAVAVALGSIWKAWNDLVFNEKASTAGAVRSACHDLLSGDGG
jgi:hypothetical protein